MRTRPASAAALVALLVGVGLLANPVYVQPPPDRGSVLLAADPSSPADFAAGVSPAVTRVDDLPPHAGFAARRALVAGSFALPRSGPPLVLHLLSSQWEYLGSQRRTAVYRPHVRIAEGSTTLTVERVALHAVERELGVTPPGRLNETDHPKEIAWLATTAPSVVTVGAFDAAWERRLETAVDRGRVRVPNGNDASSLAPLDGEVEYVVRDDRFYGVSVEATGSVVSLTATPAADRVALADANVTVVRVAELPPDVRPAVRDAVTAPDGYARVHRDETNVSRLDSLEGDLLRHGESYYRLRRGHADDIDFTPLIRLGLAALGVVLVAVGLGIEGWTRSRE